MRYLIILFVVILAFLGFRAVKNADKHGFWNLKGVKGNGNVVENVRDISSFNALKASRGLNVYLTKGEEEKAVVIADENLHEYIVVENKGESLILKTSENVRKAEKLEIHVTYKELDKITVSSGADVYANNMIESEYLKVSASSGATIKLEVSTDDLTCNASSGANINLKVNAQKSSCDVSSGANAKMTGATKRLDVNASSGANANLRELQAHSCYAKASSAGNIKINITEFLDARASTGGSVSYSGDPQKIERKESTGGSVRKY